MNFILGQWLQTGAARPERRDAVHQDGGVGRLAGREHAQPVGQGAHHPGLDVRPERGSRHAPQPPSRPLQQGRRTHQESQQVCTRLSNLYRHFILFHFSETRLVRLSGLYLSTDTTLSHQLEKLMRVCAFFSEYLSDLFSFSYNF